MSTKRTRSTPASLTRRALLIGGAVVVVAGGVAAGVDTNVLPGRSTMFRALGLDGTPGRIPHITPGPMATGTFVSQARQGRTVAWAVSYPPGSKPGDSIPVLIVLHGFNGGIHSAFGTHLGLDRFLAKAVKDGATPFAIAAVTAGNTYYHARKTGEDAGAMITDEYIPLLAKQGLHTSKVAFLGWSMGGFGALHLAMKLGAGRVASVVAESPALWTSASRAAKGAFDSVADFDANTPFGRQSELDGIAVTVDCGTGDGFYPTAQKYVAGFAKKPAGGFQPGAHNDAYWRRVAPAQLAFVAANFA